jgi:hypothetical protein
MPSREVSFPRGSLLACSLVLPTGLGIPWVLAEPRDYPTNQWSWFANAFQSFDLEDVEARDCRDLNLDKAPVPPKTKVRGMGNNNDVVIVSERVGIFGGCCAVALEAPSW